MKKVGFLFYCSVYSGNNEFFFVFSRLLLSRVPKRKNNFLLSVFMSKW